jgi:hypothetical protein
MKQIMENLLALQALQFSNRPGAKACHREIEALKKEIPSQILGHYDRLVARGRKGVAIVRRGVCTECHIRLATGALATLARGADIQLCGNCGRYLFLPDAPATGPSADRVSEAKARELVTRDAD